MNTEDRVKDVEGLTDSIILILSHLDKLPNGNSLDEIIQLIEHSPVANYKSIFEDAKKFYDDNGRFPEPQYLESKYVHKFYTVNQDFSYDVYIDFTNQLRKYKKLKELNSALSELDLDKITDIVNKDVKIRSKGHEISIDNIEDIYEVMEQQPHGMLLGIPEVDYFTKGLDYGTLNVISAPVSTFKCVVGNTRVHTSLGYGYIKDIPHGEVDSEGFSPCNILARDNQRVSDFYYGGFKETYKISSKFFKLEGTPIHRIKVLTHDGIDWKKLEDISKGDTVCLDQKRNFLFNNVTTKPKDLSHLSEEDYGWILGALYGDGCVYSNGVVGFTGTEKHTNLFNSITGLAWTSSKDKRRKDTYTIRSPKLSQLNQELRDLGFFGKANTKEIPEWIFSSNSEFITGFISGLIDTDGRVTKKEFYINLKSEKLIYGLRDLFNLYGVFPKIDKINFTYRYKGVERPEYIFRLTLLKQDAKVLNFLKLRTDKANGLNDYLSNLDGKNTECAIIYPMLWRDEVTRLFNEKIRPRGYSYCRKNRGSLRVYEFLTRDKYNKSGRISKLSFNKFLTLLEYDDYKDCQFYKDLQEYNFKTVDDIEQGYSEVYDISVPTTMTFTANGLVNHNTTMAISTAYHACFHEGKNIIYLTLEVTPAKVMFNLLARHAYEMGTPLKAGSLKKASLTDSEKEIFKNVVADWKKNCKGNIRIVGTGDIEEYTTTYLEMFINKKREEMGGLDMLYIDYLNLLKNKVPPSLKLDQYQSLNFYTQFFTDLSIRFNFILMMLCQISRGGTEKLDNQASKEGGKKLASTTFFAEANEVERSASVAFILHATRAMKNRNNVDIFLVKNRDGACPEEPITTVVVPEYFLVGTKDFSNLNNTQDLINNCMTNSDYSVDNLADMDISGFDDVVSESIDIDD